MHFISERLLLAKARRGNSQAFAKLYDEYVDQIYRFILFKVSTVELAQDLSADTFLKSWQYLQHGREVSSFKAFVYRVARNLVIDHYRVSTQATLPLETVENFIGPSLEQEMHIKTDLADAMKFIAGFSEDIQEILILRHVDGLRIKEIAEIVEKNEGAVRVTLHRVHAKLKEHAEHNE